MKYVMTMKAEVNTIYLIQKKMKNKKMMRPLCWMMNVTLTLINEADFSSDQENEVIINDSKRESDEDHDDQI